MHNAYGIMAKILEFRKSTLPTPCPNHTTQKTIGLSGDSEPTVSPHVIRMAEFLVTRKGYVSPQNVDIRQKGLRSYSLKELEQMAVRSGETDWSSRPAFYRALGLEILARLH